MADEPLSREELETLLDIAQAKSGAEETARRREANGPCESTGATGDLPDHVLSYDLSRSQRLDNAQLRALASIHEAIAGGLTISLSDWLRAKVKVKLVAVDETTFGEFGSGLPEPTCLNVVRNAPLAGRMVVQLDHSMVFPIIDRLLGGGHEPAVVVRRPLTQIELRLVSRVTGLVLDDFRKAWQSIVELQPTVELVECHPHAIRILAENEVVVVARFEVALADARGTMATCMPVAALRPVRDLLGSRSRVGQVAPSHESADGRHQARVVELVAELAETHLSPTELANLQVGDIIATETGPQDNVAVRLDGITRFHGRAGAAKGHKAVQVESVVEFE